MPPLLWHRPGRYVHTDPYAMLNELVQQGTHATMVRTGNEPAFLQSQYLAQAIQVPGSPFKRVKERLHGRHPGATSVYVSTHPVNPDLNVVRQLGILAKLSNAIKTQF